MSLGLEKRAGSLNIPEAVAQYLSGAEEADGVPSEELARFRSQSLRAIVQRAYERSPFYKEKMRALGLSPDDVLGSDDITKLPFLTKDEMRGNPWLLMACPRSDVALIQVSTGTTGGEEIYMMHTRSDEHVYELAPRYSKLFPVGPGDLCLNALPYEMSTSGLAFHRMLMSGSQATVIAAGKGGAYSTPQKTVKVIRDLRPNVVVTTPSWAITLAEEASQCAFDLKSLGVKKLWLTGEGCSPAFRRRVEELWGTRANFFYGSLECGALGIECDAHDGYHLLNAHVNMELVDPATGRHVNRGDTGEIVVTSLVRYDNPIIRFRTGDLGCIDDAPCPCGTTLPRFQLRGRAFDQVRFQGKALSPFFLEEVLMRIPEVGNWYQFVVPSSGDGNLKVRCELAGGVSPLPGIEGTLAARMQAVIGIPFEFEIVERMPRPTVKAARVVRA
jgi:phenylacetate-CoA ligase